MRLRTIRFVLLICLGASAGLPAAGQGATVAFGGIKGDPTLPVEVTADSLSVDQGNGKATFSGNVLIGQGAMRLSAAEVRVEYAKDDKSKIERMFATGGVTLVNGADAAESREADYAVGSGTIVMRGDVLLTQGPNAISGQTLTVDISTGKGVMEGRVKTVLKPAGGN